MDTLYIAITNNGFTVTRADTPSALAQIALSGNYVFDNNVEVAIRVTDNKEVAPTDDPLNHLVFSLTFRDKVDGQVITNLMGRLYVAGGIEALEQKYVNDFAYITRKLDFYEALDNKDDFFDVVETRYTLAQATAIKQAITNAGALNTLNAYCFKEKVLAVPATTSNSNKTPEQVRTAILKILPKPNYMVMTDTGNLPMIEAIAGVMDKLNNHVFIDAGSLTDWKQVTALVNSLSINDHRLRILWNPNKARPSNATTILARKKWRPCVGDYLGKHLLRNALLDTNGVPPLHDPIGGYRYPISFVGMEQLEGVNLDEEAQNALADAGVIVVMNENFQDETRWIYGDVLTQYDSKTSALRLANASEIETFTANGIIAIAKKHLLSDMPNYIDNAYSDSQLFLDACVSWGLLQYSQALAGYYSLTITPRADKPFEAVDIKFGRRPTGAVRQVYFETTINK